MIEHTSALQQTLLDKRPPSVGIEDSRMVAHLLTARPRTPSVNTDLAALLPRMRRRLYPETLPVLVSYWLKTVCARGYELRWWRRLHGELTQSLAEQFPHDAASRHALTELHEWIQNAVILPGQIPPSPASRLASIQTSLDPGRLKPYVNRLLNEWLPVEVARLLVNDGESAMWQEGGIPVLAIATALERLLVRERLSPETLDTLLNPELFSPRYVYPADVEILHDVVLALVGRTSAPAPPVMPARLLCVARASPLPADYGEAVRNAFLVVRPSGEELHVPVAPAQCRQILEGDHVRIGSVLVTMDGRWWESENLLYGENDAVVYRPMGRLRIDFSTDHARLRVPWLEARLRWCGEVHFPDTFELFGREWHASRWEEDADRTWLDLEFSRVLPVISEDAQRELRRWRPASVDIAWAALGNALASSILQNSRDPIEQLRHAHLIPLGRALFELTASVLTLSKQARDTIETRLKAIRYLEAPLLAAYGRVPWRIVPARVRTALRRRGRSDLAFEDLMNQVFEGPPETTGAASTNSAHSQATSSFFPRTAA